MSARDLIEGEAELEDEENDESFDEDTGEARVRTNGTNGDIDDSSEEEEDDDDEEAAEAIRKGFIVDDEEDEPEERARRRRKEKKRRREEREREEEVLDEEDLDLIGEANPEFQRRSPSQPKLKRLKRGHKEDGERNAPRGLADIFSEDEEDDPDVNDVQDDRTNRFRPEWRAQADEFDDFIEEDDPTDEDEKLRLQEEREIARPRAQGLDIVGAQASGLDEATLELMREAFGDGEDYQWALTMEEELEEQELAEQALELKDVFEPSQLSEKLLTDEDMQIRATDEPERFQIARKPYKHLTLTDEQFREEALWISRMMPRKTRLSSDLAEPVEKAIGKVLEFLITDEVEVPFIFQHRKDYLIHAVKEVADNSQRHKDGDLVVNAKKLLNQDDLWNILEYDLKFRALIDKRNTLQATYDRLRDSAEVQDNVFEEMIPVAETMEELQDVQDYLYFQHASHIKDLQVLNGGTNGTQKRPGSGKSLFERIRNGPIYSMVRAFGLSADAFAQNSLREGPHNFTDDPSVRPDDMADSEALLDPPEFATGQQVLKAAKLMFAEEIAMSPKMRKVMRRQYYMTGVIECFRTEKGLKKIDEQHPYYEFKYLRNQQLSDIARQPDMYLRMLKAEEEGLIEVRIRLQGYEDFKKKLLKDLASDNFSEIAEAWNTERKQVLELALAKLNAYMVKGVKENLKTRCEDEIASMCRTAFYKKLDQAPYKPYGMQLGTIPRVLALSNGTGVHGRDAICWTMLSEEGKVVEMGKFIDLHVDEAAKDSFASLVHRRTPDVIAVAGFTVETLKLVRDIERLVEEKDLRGGEAEDPAPDEELSKRLEVVLANDEVARLYQTSERASKEYPGFAALSRYCVALGRYLQNPLKEYAALGNDIASLTFHPSQQLVPQEKILKQLETSLVDMVNLCGVDINEAVNDSYTANLLPFVCGLGPRKATSVLKAINANGGEVINRAELVGDLEAGKLPVMGQRVWNNCASFLFINYDKDDTEITADYLDNTRVHPEDYELGRKMAADAQELDEEDIKAIVEERGPAAVVRSLVVDNAQEKVNDLVLEEYADQLERNFNQRKRATLETIRAELIIAYEELRRSFTLLSTDEIFTMLTGETRESLAPGMIVPVSIKRVLRVEHQLEVALDCGIRGFIFENEISDRAQDIELNQMFSPHQTIQAKILSLSRSALEATLTIREEELQRPYRKHIDRMRDEWDELQEERDKELDTDKNTQSGRTQRVIKHPLFRNFNAAQAEEYLGSQSRGDAVIRPSSKGLDHIAVTWKVADNVYQHIDVLELDKENEFSVGRTLKIRGKYTYSDLDELIVNHVKAMARKVDDMMAHEKFQNGSKSETERWLTTYTEANPKRSVYAFCIDTRHPGYFQLCFKAGQHARLASWPVRVIPQAFELQQNAYPDMRALCNGFKLLYMNMQNSRR